MSILVVDDSEKLRMAIVMFLKKMGFTDVQDADGEQSAFKLLRTKRYVLVITDTQMEESESGWNICRFVKRYLPNTKIILMSANAEMLAQARELAIPNDGIFDKNTGIPVVLKMVKDLGFTPS